MLKIKGGALGSSNFLKDKGGETVPEYTKMQNDVKKYKQAKFTITYIYFHFPEMLKDKRGGTGAF